MAFEHTTMLASARCMVCTSRNRLSPDKVHRIRRPSSSNSGATFQNSPPTFHSPIRLTSWVRMPGRCNASGTGSGSRVPTMWVTTASPAMRLPRFLLP